MPTSTQQPIRTSGADEDPEVGDAASDEGRECRHGGHARQPRPPPLRPCPTCPTTPADPAAPMSDMPDNPARPRCAHVRHARQARRPRCSHVRHASKLADHVAGMSEKTDTPPSRPPSCANSWQQFNIIPIGCATAPVPEVVPARRCPTTPRRATWRLQVLEISHEGSPFSAHGSGTRAANRSREPPRAGGSSLRLLRDAGEVCPRSRHGSDRPCVV